MARRSGDAAGLALLIGAAFGFLWSLVKYPIQTIIGVNLIALIFFPDYFWYIFFPSAIVGLIYYYSKKTNKDAEQKKTDQKFTEKYGSNVLDKNKPLIERNENIIQKFYSELRKDSWPHYVENKASDCLKEIAEREGQAKLAPGHREWLPVWEKRAGIPQEWLDLKTHILERFKKRYQEVLVEQKALEEQREREYKAQQDRECQAFFEKNKDLIDKFLEIAERKVSIIDDYGDENWDLLPQEIDACITKIAKRNGASETDIKDFFKKHYSWKLGEEYAWLRNKLKDVFTEYHTVQKARPAKNFNVNGLSGVEFETYIAKVLKENGYDDVRGTPATGDQGADLIAKKDGKTIIIQAKRYVGTVGNKAVQEVISAIQFYGGDEGWVVTNSTFTPSAKALAQKSNIKLIDGHDLSNGRLSQMATYHV